jgi:hypothetical protein
MPFYTVLNGGEEEKKSLIKIRGMEKEYLKAYLLLQG